MSEKILLLAAFLPPLLELTFWPDHLQKYETMSRALLSVRPLRSAECHKMLSNKQTQQL